MRVLYLNHTAQVSGGERSLLSLLGGLPDDVTPTVACPDGALAVAVNELGVTVTGLRGTEGSLKLHPWHTTRGVIDIARAAFSARRLAAGLGADIVHANSLRSGLAGAFAASMGGTPTVVHVHDCLPPGHLSSLTSRVIGKRSAVVIANSHYTKASLARLHLPEVARVVHGPVDLERFDPAAVDRNDARASLGLENSTFVLGMNAQITPWKGQDDAVRILGLLKENAADVRLLLVGSPKFVSAATRYDNREYARALEQLTESLDLQKEVIFLGEREDIPLILRSLDVLLAPSWEEPFGMAIVEAMAMEVPVVATNVGGPSEIVRDGEEGLLLCPRSPQLWATAIQRLITDPDLRAEMGQKGRSRAVSEFSVERHVEGVLAAYEEALSHSG
jgi:glycosyltransferase involved in cell wall biosynthesis